MCGRFTLTVDPGELQEAFPDLVITSNFPPRYNITPAQPVAVIANTGENELEFFHWGLIPSWAKDPEIGSRMINARAESLASKPSFSKAFRERRCLILADGFYEWQNRPQEKSKTPYYIHLKSGKPFAFAGLWDIWSPPNGSEIRSCTIITTQPNDLILPLHNRMPVILPEEHYSTWLSKEVKPAQELQYLLAPFPSERMEAYPVSKLVNNPSNDTPQCIQRFA